MPMACMPPASQISPGALTLVRVTSRKLGPSCHTHPLLAASGDQNFPLPSFHGTVGGRRVPGPL